MGINPIRSYSYSAQRYSFLVLEAMFLEYEHEYEYEYKCDQNTTKVFEIAGRIGKRFPDAFNESGKIGSEHPW
jgi:hypothetical protein